MLKSLTSCNVESKQKVFKGLELDWHTKLPGPHKQTLVVRMEIAIHLRKIFTGECLFIVNTLYAFGIVRGPVGLAGYLSVAEEI